MEEEAWPRLVTPGLTFNIDPEGCKDVDDVLSLERSADGVWRLWITIADVDAYVPQNSLLDLDAAERVSTV